MKLRNVLVFAICTSACAGVVYGDDRSFVVVPQMPLHATVVTAGSAPASADPGTPHDSQSAVINDPRISDFGRANAMLNFSGQGSQGGVDTAVIKQDALPAGMDESELGGNVAIINQDGASNRSTVIQSGRNNAAIQTQKGQSNDIYLQQAGDNNMSDETQAGQHNRKVKIQNGHRSEMTIDQTDN